MDGVPSRTMAARCRHQDWSRPPGPHRPREWGNMVRNKQVPPDTSLQADRLEPRGPPRMVDATTNATTIHLRQGHRRMQNPLDNQSPIRVRGRLWNQISIGLPVVEAGSASFTRPAKFFQKPP